MMTKRDAEGKNKISSFHLEIDKFNGKISVNVSSVLAVEEFSTGVCILKFNKGGIRILGEGLELTVYQNKNVEISGKIRTVEFV